MRHLALATLVWVVLVEMTGCKRVAPPGIPENRDTVSVKPTVFGDEVLLKSPALLDSLRGKRIGIVANHTAVVFDKTHLVDSLKALGLDIQVVFAPEHGFRGEQEAGYDVANETDPRTGIRVVSLYGDTKKPPADVMAGLDVVLYDIQDVGARFYTYLTTLSLVMEACAESGATLWVLDRPNPNGHAVFGPALQHGWESFVGAHPVPIMHGMTLGEYAQMVNGQRWLPDSATCKLRVVQVENWYHGQHWEGTNRTWIPPSPNLPTPRAARLYPALCWFEGTNVSLGRGTDHPFERVGLPGFVADTVLGQQRLPSISPLMLPRVWLAADSFLPLSIPGKSLRPPHENRTCNGVYFHGSATEPQAIFELSLTLLQATYRQYPALRGAFAADYGWDKPYFDPYQKPNPWFEKLTGSGVLRYQIEQGRTVDEILQSWAKDCVDFRLLRAPYLLYPEAKPDKGTASIG